jgi:hypothetical protein
MEGGIVNKTAKEMFEKLGYRQLKQPKNYQHLLVYEKYDGRFRETSLITFNTSGRVFSKTLNEEGWCIFIDELKAINQQCKELGWID